ncbi:MAG: hypothetical protein ABI954_09605 [Pyrinomonadaceae bacterium]
MENLQKQDANKSGSETTRENFSAEEIAQQASYDDSTQIAQQMRRGDESKGDPDERDEVGTAAGNKSDNQKGEK